VSTNWQEMLSTDAPEELCDPITMTLFVDPVVSPSGETYSKDTVSRFDNGLCPAGTLACSVHLAQRVDTCLLASSRALGWAGQRSRDLPLRDLPLIPPSLPHTHTCPGIDPATREKIDDIARLPPNRAISRQVNGYIQKSLGKFADYLLLHTSAQNHSPAPPDSALQIEGRGEGEGAETAEVVTEAMLALASILSAISGRSDDASLNFKRVVLQLLDSSSPVCVCVCACVCVCVCVYVCVCVCVCVFVCV
jgi:hypothetical protein